MLYRAIYAGYIDLVSWLLENGANVNAVMSDGYTCLDVAVDRGSVIDIPPNMCATRTIN